MKTIKDWNDMDMNHDKDYWTNRMTEMVFRVITFLIFAIAIAVMCAPAFLFWATGCSWWLCAYFVYFAAATGFLIWCAFHDDSVNGEEDYDDH